jgi:hypothetical protein
MVKNPKGSSAVPEPLAPPIVVLPQLATIRVTARPCRSQEAHAHAAIRAALDLHHCAATQALVLVTTPRLGRPADEFDVVR